MPSENPELLDALEFKRKLIARTKDSNDEEGQRIGEYLKNIVPDWQGMRATRLYKHIQDMLKNADDTRRFEIDLVAKRAVYIIPLVIIFFSTFGYLFYIAYSEIFFVNDSDAGGKKFSSIEFLFLFALAIIASINSFLSFCLAMLNLQSRHCQKNWEHHVDYLMAILGMNLTRAFLQKKTVDFTISKINSLVGIVMFGVWLFLAIGIFGIVILALFSEVKCSESNWRVYCDSHIFSLFRVVIIAAVFLFIFAVHAITTMRRFFEINGAWIEQKLSVKRLQKFHYTKKVSNISFAVEIYAVVLVLCVLIINYIFNPL